MDLRGVFHLQGWLLIFLGGAMLVPVPFSLYYRSDDLAALGISALLTALTGLMLVRLTRIERDVRVREGFAIVTFGWVLAAAFGALPFVISGAIPSYTDAFFETMSGFTTTGASILTDIEALPRGLLFWRSFTHWLGGMGIILLSLAILPFLGVGGMQLFKAEVPGPVADKLAPRVTQTAKILWGVYIALSAVQTVLLMVGGMDLFDALCHTFGTMATGGFSTRNASIAAFPSPFIQWVIVVFMFLAGVNFALHFRVVCLELRYHILAFLLKLLLKCFDSSVRLFYFRQLGKQGSRVDVSKLLSLCSRKADGSKYEGECSNFNALFHFVVFS